MGDAITLEDVLGIKFLEKWEWSPDGKHIAYLWDDGGVSDLWLVSPGVAEPAKLTSAAKGVTDFAWSPEGKHLWFLKDGSLCRLGEPFAPDEIRTVFASASDLSGLSASPDCSALAFLRDGKVWLFQTGLETVRESSLPGRCLPLGEAGCALWSPRSDKFAFAFRDDDDSRQIGIAGKDGSVLWRSWVPEAARPLDWLDDDNFLFLVPEDRGRSARILRVDTRNGYQIRDVLAISGTGKGPAMFVEVVVSPDRATVLLLLENDGWAHWYAVSRDSILNGCAGQEIRQLTFGPCEDFGHAGDRAAFWPDSRSFVYASNRKRKGERHLFRYHLDSGKDEEIVSLPGQNTVPKVSAGGRLAFVHCDALRNMDIWVAEKDGPVQVTYSMPPAWASKTQYVPEEVSFESAGGITIHGYLMKPDDVPPGRKLPGIVWVHGGPIRQMRPGWHPMRSYALFHGFNQYLVGKGYVVLSVNFRGGIGYGRDFREALFHRMGVDDVADVCNAGLFLKRLPYVDPDRIGVWGLSYGGYMVLHCLAQRPEVFRAGVNIAGIWDFAQYTRWADKRYGRGSGLFKIYLGGNPDESPDLYRQASPRTFVQELKAPFLNLQGTADANVDFAQMDAIIKDCVEHGKRFELCYYPGEVHTFARRKTWLDAMRRVEEFFDRYLKGPV